MAEGIHVKTSYRKMLVPSVSYPPSGARYSRTNNFDDNRKAGRDRIAASYSSRVTRFHFEQSR